jgi:hypothetical protein
MTGRPDMFEGQPEYVKDFWGRAQRGEADEVDGTVFRFTITKEDSEKYHELKVGSRLILAKAFDECMVCSELLPPRRTN